MDNSHKHPGSIDFIEYDLANGLHVILCEDHKAPLVCVNIAYHVGSKNETPQRAGFAHLFEHLLFEGSTNVPRGMFDKYITQAGGHNNAYTTEDKTNYYEVLPSHQLELALWLESDRMLGFVLGDESLRTQKDVVKEEKRERYDNTPYGTLSERMMRLAYTSFPYKWTVIGDMDTIEAATLDDVKDFYATFYAPSNAVLVISGDIKVEETKALVEKYFSGIPNSTSPIVRPVFTDPEQQAERRELVDAEAVPLPGTFYAYRMPPEGTTDAIALDLLTDILSTGRSSRMYQNLVYTKRLASEVSSYVDLREAPGLVWFYAVGNHPEQDTAGIEESLEEVISSVRDTLVGEEELTKAKNKMEMRLVASRVTATGKADQLAHSYTFFGDTNRVNSIIDDYAAITTGDLKSAAAKYLQPMQRCVVTYKPPVEQQ
ncbi:MAG TPA: pitrilysin family protein [Candidatus Kapabacteria bacterium]|nr:pitrilysin family protein [Candidatus Kapabacteria bacterium]